MAGPGGREVGRLNVKVVPDTDGFRRKMDTLLAEYGKKKIELRVDLKGVKKAQGQLKKLTEDRKVKIKVVLDDKKAKAKLAALTRDREVSVRVRADTRSASTSISNLTRRRTATINVNADTRQASAQMNQFARQQRTAGDRAAREEASRRIRIYREAARRAAKELRRLGSDFPDRIPLDVAVDPRRRMAALRAELRRLERERIELEVRLRGVRGVARRIAILARDRRMKIRADIDRSQFGRTGYFVGKAFKGASVVAIGALSGVFRSLSILSSGLGNMGNIGQKVFGGLADGTSKLAKGSSKIASVIGNVVASFLSLTFGVGIIGALVSALGALIVAAISAVAVMASVLVGGLALLALPAVFAGIAVASVVMADKNDKLKKSFVALKNTLTKTVQHAAKPMLEFFTGSLVKMNKAFQEGTPLYKQLHTSFSESTKALRPLTSGLGTFGTNTLTGVNEALKNLNQGNTMTVFSHSIGNLGATIGNFAAVLSSYASGISSSFNQMTQGLNAIGISVANWIGRFGSGQAAGVVDSFTDATVRLFDTYAKNSSVYQTAAQNLGFALSNAVPGVEQITQAFAKMSPSILATIADGINSIGTALSDPAVQKGLVDLTNGFTRLAASLVVAGTNLASTFGDYIGQFTSAWDSLRGAVKNVRVATQQDFESVISKQGETSKKVSAGLKQIQHSMELFAESTSKPGAALDKLGWELTKSLRDNKQFTGAVKTNFDKLQSILASWQNNKGILTDQMRKEFEGVSKVIDQTGNPALQRYRDKVRQTFEEAGQNAQKMKQALIEALKAKGVTVDPGLIKQIDALLGGMTASAATKSQEAVQNIQKNFALLPGIIQQALNEAKTPEELQKRLLDVQKVMDSMTPQIAASFAKLPTAMQQTLSQSTTAFESWTGLETFRQKVVTAVAAVVAEFQKIGPAIGSASSPILGFNTQIGTMSGSIQGLNAQANWLNWIFNQIGAQAGWAGWQMGNFASNSSRASSSLSQLNSSANGLQVSLIRVGASALVASVLLASLSSRAGGSGAGFAVFAGQVSGYMVLAAQSVRDWTNNMLGTLRGLSGKAASAGRLTSFVGSVKSSMAQAQATVAGAVANMLAQLQKLNTTVTATVNINRNETTRKKTIDEGEGRNLPRPPVAPMLSVPFEAPAARAFDAAMATAGRTVAKWRNSGGDVTPSDASTSSGTTKNFTFNNTINGPAPTEKKLRKQWRFADALYGD